MFYPSIFIMTFTVFFCGCATSTVLQIVGQSMKTLLSVAMLSLGSKFSKNVYLLIRSVTFAFCLYNIIICQDTAEIAQQDIQLPSDKDNQLVQMAFKDFDTKRFDDSEKV